MEHGVAYPDSLLPELLKQRFDCGYMAFLFCAK
jgi:hypothetical protein